MSQFWTVFRSGLAVNFQVEYCMDLYYSGLNEIISRILTMQERRLQKQLFLDAMI